MSQQTLKQILEQVETIAVNIVAKQATLTDTEAKFIRVRGWVSHRSQL